MSSTKSTARGGIYQIRSLKDGKIYIGSAVRFRTRWNQHRSHLRRDVHHSRRLQNAWNKYGASQFVFEVLEVVPDPGDLIRVEQEWLDWFKPYKRKIGYNECPTAGSNLGRPMAEETKVKLSQIKTGIPKSDEAKANISEGTRTAMANPELRAHLSAVKKAAWTPEKAAKLGESRRGIKYGAERIAKTAAASRRRAQDPEYRDKLSAAQKGIKKRPKTAEEKANLSAKLKGRKKHPEFGAKISAAKKGKAPSAEARAKMSASAKLRYQRLGNPKLKKAAKSQMQFAFTD